LADYVTEVSTFLRLRGGLYEKNPNYEHIQEQLLQQQIKIEAQQNLLSDLILNTRTIVKESTNTGRVLVKTYLEVTELYSSVMTTFQEYSLLHNQFDDTGILEAYRTVILSLTEELDEISLSIRISVSSAPKTLTKELLKKASSQFESLRQHFMSNKNVAHFVSLGRILKNLENITEKINRLHFYSTYEIKIQKSNADEIGIIKSKPVSHFRPLLFFDNLNVKSNIFRHALRVSLALLVGYIASLFFKVDHGYWILLTIVVILKPAYALSKRRNTDRLIGTLIGITIGLLLLYFIKNDTILLILMVLLMTGSFMFLRTNYFMSVLLMTPYLLIVFHFLFPDNLSALMLERLIDTAIGSVIAFFASLFLVPAWEKTTIKSYMLQMLKSNAAYYAAVAGPFAGTVQENRTNILATRREVLIALANLSDAFTRMLSEPKRYRSSVKTVHRFVS
ncbi:MAG: FUSC family protein, partial [Ferruginibacter sp.]